MREEGANVPVDENPMRTDFHTSSSVPVDEDEGDHTFIIAQQQNQSTRIVIDGATMPRELLSATCESSHEFAAAEHGNKDAPDAPHTAIEKSAVSSSSAAAAAAVLAAVLAARIPYDSLVRLRGPFLIGAVVFLSVLPHLQYLSLVAIVRTLILLAGVGLFLHDTALLLIDRIRHTISVALDAFVLDDFLRAVFDPETGWIATSVGMVTGNAAMYTLPVSAEQRVELVQSALYLADRQEAATILQQAGGCKHLLPGTVQAWLHQDSSRLSHGPAPQVCLDMLPLVAREWVQDLNVTRSILQSSEWEPPSRRSKAIEEASPSATAKTTLTVDDADSHSTASDFSDNGGQSRQLFTDADALGGAVEQEERAEERAGASQQTRRPAASPTSPPLPHEVMSSIVRNMMMQRGKHALNSLPDGTLERTGMVAAAFLMIQFRYSRRSRQLLWGILQGSTTVCLSGVLAGCVAAVAAKHQYGDPRDDTGLVSMTLQSLLRQAGTMGRKWKDYLAVLVLYYVGRRKPQGSQQD